VRSHDEHGALKRADFLPRHAEARRLRPGILTDQPTEEYVVTTRTRSPRT